MSRGRKKLIAVEHKEVIRLLREFKNVVRAEVTLTSASNVRIQQSRSSSDEDHQEAAELGDGDGGDATWRERGSGQNPDKQVHHVSSLNEAGQEITFWSVKCGGG